MILKIKSNNNTKQNYSQVDRQKELKLLVRKKELIQTDKRKHRQLDRQAVIETNQKSQPVI